jgi:hypothetical protein
VLIARSFGVIEMQSEMTYRCNETTTLGPNPLDDGIAAASGFVGTTVAIANAIEGLTIAVQRDRTTAIPIAGSVLFG